MLRFTIRDVLWLTVVVGLAVGWWLDHRSLDRQMKLQRIDEQFRRAFDGGNADSR
jgi:hypothetical protein